MNRFDEPRDLSPLDPGSDPVRWERMVGGINRGAAIELRRRQALPEPGVLLMLSDWRRPAAAVCTAIAAGAAAILLLAPPSSGDADGGLASALGYPTVVADWVATGADLSLEEILFAMEEGE